MTKKSYYVIYNTNGRYGGQDLLHFETIDDALEAFRYLAKAEATKVIDYEYIDSKQRFFEIGHPEFRLEQKYIEIYTPEEIEEFKKREIEKQAAQAEKEENAKP